MRRSQWMCRQVISIHALLAESDKGIDQVIKQCLISIHALLAESDPAQSAGTGALLISIHALLAESDLEDGCVNWCDK